MTRGVNPARWWEYSISASLMVVLIAMLAGVTAATALLALFGVNAAMILFGLVMERVNLGRERVDLRPFVYGCIAGIVPWLAIGLQRAVMDRGLWRYAPPELLRGLQRLVGHVPHRACDAQRVVVDRRPDRPELLLIRVSGAALLERCMSETRPGYEDYVQRTSSFLPRPPKRT